MGAIQDRLTITLDEAKAHLKISTSTAQLDTNLTNAVSAVKDLADAFCQNDFLDEDGVTQLPIPDAVRLWCLQILHRFTVMPASNVKEAQLADVGRLIWNECLDYTLIHTYRWEEF